MTPPALSLLIISPSKYVGKKATFGPLHYAILLLLIGCETWSLTLREEHRLRVFENRVLRRILGPRRNEVTGEWRKFVICTLRQV
jgi:hypothetical protein